MARVPLTAQDPVRVGGYWLAGRLGRSEVYEGYGEDGVRVVVRLLTGGGRPEAGVLPCVAAVLASGEQDGRAYVVTEYVEGPSLRTLVDRLGPLPGGDLRRLAIGAATALAALHDAGTPHGGLTPGAVLLGRDGPRVTGHPAAELGGGQDPGWAADVRAWAELVLFAATGRRAEGPGQDGPPLDALPPALRPSVEAALSAHPEDRPTARALLRHLLAHRDPPPSGDQPDRLPAHRDPPPEGRDLDRLLDRGSAVAGGLRPPWHLTRGPAVRDVAEPIPDEQRALTPTARAGAAGRDRPRRPGGRHAALVAAVAVLVVVASVLFVRVTTTAAERDRAAAARDAALSRALMAESESLAAADPRTARLLAVAAARVVPPSPWTRAAVRAAVARPELAVLRGFPSVADAVTFSPDGRTVAASGQNALLRVWDTRTLAPVSWPVTDDDGASGTAIAYRPDGRELAVADTWGRVHFWDTATRAHRIGGGTRPWSRSWAAYNPDGTLLATTRALFEESRLWDPATAAPVATLRTLEGVPGPVAFSPDGRLLAVAYFGGPIRIFDAASGLLTGDPLAPGPEAVDGGAAALAFSPDGRLLAGTTGGEQVRLWDVATRRPAGRPLAGHAALVTGAAFSPDGAVLATAAQDRTVRLWDVATGAPLGDPLTGPADTVTAVAFSPDGATLAGASADTTVRLWRVPRGRARPLALPAPDGGPDSGPDGGPDGRADSGPDGGADSGPDGGADVPADRPVPAPGAPDTSRAVLSGDGTRLVVQPYDATRPGPGRLWSWSGTGRAGTGPLTGRRLAIRRDQPVNALAVSRDGRMLAASGRDDDGHGRDVTIRGGPPGTPPVRGRPLAFSPDGRLLATAVSAPAVSAPAVRIRPLGAGGPAVAGGPLAGEGEPAAAAFSGDGRLLAVGTSTGPILVWDVATGARRARLPGHPGGVTALAFGGGRLLASGGADRTARLWDVTTGGGRPLTGPLTGHTGPVDAVAFAPGGTLLATGSTDRTVRLWDVPTGRPLGPPLGGHGGAVAALAFAPGGRTLVAVAADRAQVRGDAYAVWHWDTSAFAADPATTACAQAARTLTGAEWSSRLPGLPYRDPCR
ncbi:WD40 repeat domain-containing serine/threonine-protein kinase [Actinomadura sp. ATCC 31491]|uniref:WD40 repeat domain-containing serine/threonine-protein kinase n=1 Tax=Actinomadura luzonensis TaxID=2805427 RepID=A0ABT0G492_9ACTN|nr:WD40 repeat domain-containing serine/threonine-protein kinase [Actinomadura luzonensis]MCK2219382.1 WD40 repeat domain-containing serine/threonine-protein kinase [Actinomadura luzonensis]